MFHINSYITTNSIVNISKKNLKSLNAFWLGFIIYIQASIMTSLGLMEGTITQVGQAAGLLILFPSAISLIKVKFDDEYLKIVFSLYFIWLLAIMLRGFSTDYRFIKEFIFDLGLGMMSYLTPLILLFPRNIAFYKKAFEVILIFSAFFILFIIIFFNQLRTYLVADVFNQGVIENLAELFSRATPFLLITYLYHSDKKKIFAMVVTLITIYFALIRARRGLLFISLSTLSVCFILYLVNTRQKALAIFMSVVLAIGGFIYMNSISDSKNGNIFTFLMARKDEDTRSNVEEAFYADMTTTEWIIGKGINGEYYCPGVENVMNNTSYRNIIETGYLQIILKGGIISLALLLLILIPAIYKGLFNSNNILSKGAALWIFLWTIYLYPTIGIGFCMYHLLVWISVGICYSGKIRAMADSDIKEILLK